MQSVGLARPQGMSSPMRRLPLFKPEIDLKQIHSLPTWDSECHYYSGFHVHGFTIPGARLKAPPGRDRLDRRLIQSVPKTLDYSALPGDWGCHKYSSATRACAVASPCPAACSQFSNSATSEGFCAVNEAIKKKEREMANRTLVRHSIAATPAVLMF